MKDFMYKNRHYIINPGEQKIIQLQGDIELLKKKYIHIYPADRHLTFKILIRVGESFIDFAQYEDKFSKVKLGGRIIEIPIPVDTIVIDAKNTGIKTVYISFFGGSA